MTKTGSALTYYNNAKDFLAKAAKVDEVKTIRDKSLAMSVYAKISKDKELEEHAREIRARAERRIGEMMKEQPKAKGARPTGQRRVMGKPAVDAPTLKEAGIDKNLADKARKAAAMPEEEFERHVEELKIDVTSPKVRKKNVDLVLVSARDSGLFPVQKAWPQNETALPDDFRIPDHIPESAFEKFKVMCALLLPMMSLKQLDAAAGYFMKVFSEVKTKKKAPNGHDAPQNGGA